MSGSQIPPDSVWPSITKERAAGLMANYRNTASDHGWTVHFAEIDLPGGNVKLEVKWDRPAQAQPAVPTATNSAGAAVPPRNDVAGPVAPVVMAVKQNDGVAAKYQGAPPIAAAVAAPHQQAPQAAASVAASSDRTLKLHDHSPTVALAQDLLNRAGAILDTDADFGRGTLRAVHEFRAANGMPAGDVIDADLWQRLRALPEPSPDMPTGAVAFIAVQEVGGRDYYDKVGVHPERPPGDSGVTIGVGYDLGYQENFEKDWAGLLTDQQIAALRPCLGIKGPPAQAMKDALPPITIPWLNAWTQFLRKTLPDQVKLTRATFPLAAQPLPPLCFGMLVDLIYNRGADIGPTDGSDNQRLEMFQVQQALKAGRYADIPAFLRAMQTRTKLEQVKQRRAAEAKLFEQGLTSA